MALFTWLGLALGIGLGLDGLVRLDGDAGVPRDHLARAHDLLRVHCAVHLLMVRLRLRGGGGVGLP